MSELDNPRKQVASPDDLAGEELPKEIEIRCPEYPETHTQIELRESYFYCEECENLSEYPRYQFIFDTSRELLISHHDYLNQWGPRPYSLTELSDRSKK